MTWEVIRADCVDAMQQLEEGSVDAIVTDPPYGIGFMGHEWDQPGEHGPVRSNGEPAIFASGRAYPGNHSLGGRDRPPPGQRRASAPAPSGFSADKAKKLGARAVNRERGGAMEAGRYDLSLTANRRFQAWCEVWAAEAWRVLKPGGFMLASCGTRTYQRLAVGVEEAGFEVRDMLEWIYGSGFPKSLDVAKAIDKRRDDQDEVREVCRFLRGSIDSSEFGVRAIAEYFGFHPRMVEHWAARDTDSQPSVPTLEQWDQLRDLLGFGEAMDAHVLRLNLRKGEPGEAWADRPITGVVDEWEDRSNYALTSTDGLRRDVAASDEAKRWEGWGTALKPCHEPVLVARKPFAGTVADNVLEFGTAALNIDACRVGTSKRAPASPRRAPQGAAYGDLSKDPGDGSGWNAEIGRWPGNIALAHTPLCALAGTADVRPSNGSGLASPASGGFDGFEGKSSDEDMSGGFGLETVELWDCAPGCPVAILNEQSGVLRSGANPTARSTPKFGDVYGEFPGRLELPARGADAGGAARFFYTAKTSRSERNAGLAEGLPRTRDPRKRHRQDVADLWRPRARNWHPTVKPIDLMRWLVRMVTPPGGRVLDPFAGSGTTGCAAVLEGFDFLGVDREVGYANLAAARVRWWAEHRGKDAEAVLADTRKSERARRQAVDAGQLDLLA